MITYHQCDICKGKGLIVTLSGDANKPDDIVRCNPCEGSGLIEKEKKSWLSFFKM